MPAGCGTWLGWTVGVRGLAENSPGDTGGEMPSVGRPWTLAKYCSSLSAGSSQKNQVWTDGSGKGIWVILSTILATFLEVRKFSNRIFEGKKEGKTQ